MQLMITMHTPPRQKDRWRSWQ